MEDSHYEYPEDMENTEGTAFEKKEPQKEEGSCYDPDEIRPPDYYKNWEEKNK